MLSAKLSAALADLTSSKIYRREPSRAAYQNLPEIRLLIVLVLGGLMFFTNLAGPDIYILDEAKNASCAREMLERKDWVVPTFNYSLRTQKPPLHYYFMALGYRLFGVNEFGARFFSSVFGLLTLLVLFLFTRRLLNERVAFLASMVFLSSLHIVIQFRLAVPDPYLIFFVFLSILSFYAFLATPHRQYLWLAYGALGLAVLAKGPVALVLVGGVGLGYLLLTGAFRWPTLRQLLPWYGIALFLLIALPWYIAVAITTEGEWLQRFLFQENVNRFLAPMEGHGGPVWLMAALALGGMIPFSFFFVQAFYVAWKHRSEHLLLIALLAVGVVVGFFSFSGTKLPTYIGPCLPFMAIILGFFLNELGRPGSLKRFAVPATILGYALLMVGLPIGLYLGLETQVPLASLTALSFYFVIIPLGGFISWLMALRGNVSLMVGTLAGSWIMLNLLAFWVILPKLDQLNPVAAALEKIPEQAEVVSYKRFNPAFSFYVQKPIIQFNHIDSLENHLAKSVETYILTDYRFSPELNALETNPQLLYRQRQLFEPIQLELYQH